MTKKRQVFPFDQDKFTAIRLAKKLTISDISRITGMSRNTIMYAGEKAGVIDTTLFKLAEVLECEVTDLVKAGAIA